MGPTPTSLRADQYVPLVREVLDRTGWSQAELARRIGVSRTTVNAWLKGRSPPSFTNLARIESAADALSLRVGWSIAGEGEPVHLDDVEARLVRDLRRLAVLDCVRADETLAQLGALVQHALSRAGGAPLEDNGRGA